MRLDDEACLKEGDVNSGGGLLNVSNISAPRLSIPAVNMSVSAIACLSLSKSTEAFESVSLQRSEQSCPCFIHPFCSASRETATTLSVRRE